MLDVEYFEGEEASDQDYGHQVVDLSLFIVKGVLFLYLGIVLILTNVQPHLRRSAKKAYRKHYDLENYRTTEFPFFLLLRRGYFVLGSVVLGLQIHEITDGVVFQKLILRTSGFLFVFVPNLQAEMSSLQDLLVFFHVDIVLELYDFVEKPNLQLELALKLTLFSTHFAQVVLVESEDVA